MATRLQYTAGQIAFWTMAHGDDWEQVVGADSDLLRRFDASGGDWFAGRLREIRCPVLFTASLHDNLLPDVGAQVCGTHMHGDWGLEIGDYCVNLQSLIPNLCSVTYLRRHRLPP